MSDILTVAWDRGERIGFMPRDSALVYPDPTMTVLWRPMTTATIIDFDVADMLVPPGADDGESPTDESPVAEPPEEQSPSGDGSSQGPFGPPEVLVARKRSEGLFIRHGLPVELDAPAPASVRAVLRAAGSRPVRLSSVVERRIGAGRARLRLRSSRAAVRILEAAKDEKLKAKLELVVRYADQEPVKIRRRVEIVDPKRT